MTQTELLRPLVNWPVDHVAAALLEGGEVRETLGDTSRVFELASVTKLLSAYAVLIAVEEGAIELDSPAGPPGATVRHLLAHASGVGFDSREPQRGVGERRIYSSAGYEILADLVAAETGIAFSDYLAEAVFEPLGMHTAVLKGSAGHGASASVEDLCSFAHEVLAPRLLAKQTVAEALRPQFPELAGIVPGYGRHKPCPWGLGFELRGSKQPHWTGESFPPETAGHFGMAGTYLWLVPSAGRAMVALTDRKFGPWAKPRWQVSNDHIWEAWGKPA